MSVIVCIWMERDGEGATATHQKEKKSLTSFSLVSAAMFFT